MIAELALAVAVLALLWWAARPTQRNHAARDEQYTAQVKANAERIAALERITK